MDKNIKSLRIKLKTNKSQYNEFVNMVDEFNKGTKWAFKVLDYEPFLYNHCEVYIKCQNCEEFSHDLFKMKSDNKIVCKKCLYFSRTGKNPPDIRLRSTKKDVTTADVQKVCNLPTSNHYEQCVKYAFDKHKAYLKSLQAYNKISKRERFRVRTPNKPKNIKTDTIDIHQCLGFIEEEDKIYAKTTLSTRRKFLCLDKNDYHYKYLREVIKRYKQGVSKYYAHIYVNRKSEKVYIVFPFREELISISEYNYNMTPISVDFGISKTAVISVMKEDNTHTNIRFFDGKKLLHQKRLLVSRRKKLGHNKQNDAIKNLTKKENRINTLLAHTISYQVVDIASQQENPIIIMENLKNINRNCIITRNDGKKVKSKKLKQHNYNITSWNRGMTEQDIEYKAKYKGIPTMTVPSFYNSQICSRCGCLDKRNRKSQSEFKCVNCGYTINADLNATFNESKRFKIIMKEFENRKIEPSKITNKLIEKTFPIDFWKNYDYMHCKLYNFATTINPQLIACECGI